MEIIFSNKKFEKQCNNFNSLKRFFGVNSAKKINRRLNELRAFDNLQDLFDTFPRVHFLEGDRKEEFPLDLDGPYRLICRVAKPVPRSGDGGINARKVTKVVVVERIDYHGK